MVSLVWDGSLAGRISVDAVVRQFGEDDFSEGGGVQWEALVDGGNAEDPGGSCFDDDVVVEVGLYQGEGSGLVEPLGKLPGRGGFWPRCRL